MWPVGESKTSGGRRTDLALRHSLCDLGEAVSLSGPHGSTSEQARGKITGAGAAAASDAPRDCFQLSGSSPSNVPESPSSEDPRPAPPRDVDGGGGPLGWETRPTQGSPQGSFSCSAASMPPGPQFPCSCVCGFFVCVPSAPGRPREGRLPTGHQVCMSHGAPRVTKCVDEYRYACGVIFYFLLFALKSHFPML